MSFLFLRNLFYLTASPTERGAVGKEKHGGMERATARETKKERTSYRKSFLFGLH